MSPTKSPVRRAMKQLQTNNVLKRKVKSNKKMIQVKTKQGQEDIKSWLTSHNVNSIDKLNYWKELAQEREIVLEKTLKENLLLKEKIESLEDEIDLMKAELEHFRKLSEEGLKLASILEECGIEFAN